MSKKAFTQDFSHFSEEQKLLQLILACSTQRWAFETPSVKVAGVVVGKGFRFGYKQSGTAEILKTLGTAAGLRVHVSDLVGAATPGVVGVVGCLHQKRQF